MICIWLRGSHEPGNRQPSSVEDAPHHGGARDDQEPLLLVARALVRNQDRAYAGMVDGLQPGQVEHDRVRVPLEGLLQRFSD
jgi:hypothetical protein